MPLEHINITCRDSKEFADRLCHYFDWKIRWQGHGKLGGETIHVGDSLSYLALWAPKYNDQYPDNSAINHIGVVVENLKTVETRIESLGIKTHSHADYEPGTRFYFDDPCGIEIEVVSYA